MMMIRKWLIKGFLLLWMVILVLPLSASVQGETRTISGDGYWPEEDWRASTPEEQGMDSAIIYKMLHYIISQKHNFHSVLIIRHGYLVTEAYFNPYYRGVKQDILSCTQSVTSALTGIAIQEGYIKDVRQKVVDYFPEYKIDNLYDPKKSLTIENLLTMSAGLELKWHVMSAASTNPVYSSPDPVKYVLDLPVRGEPGTYFYFNYGVSNVVGAIIQKTSGENIASLAQKKLFQPLGIHDVTWAADSMGRNWGGTGLCMSAIDMAKFGYLYLRQGVWNGRRIVPAAWVEASGREQIAWPASPSKKYGYGYFWWVEPYGYAAWGLGGQYIGVFPEQDMVVVLTGALIEDLVMKSVLQPIVETFVIPAAKSDRPLPANPKMNQQLNALLNGMASPKSQPVPPLPALATRISGKVLPCTPNALHAQSLSLRFDRKNECLLTVTLDNPENSGPADTYEIPVGLDGVFRRGEIPKSGPVALKGSWVSGDTFAIQWQDFRRPECWKVRLKFGEKRVEMEVSGMERDFLIEIQSEDYKCKVM
jgi:CubicO group peptidase (beta-lactamase class C family)